MIGLLATLQMLVGVGEVPAQKWSLEEMPVEQQSVWSPQHRWTLGTGTQELLTLRISTSCLGQ